jgi:polyisoprenoid-binding protein YceI
VYECREGSSRTKPQQTLTFVNDHGDDVVSNTTPLTHGGPLVSTSVLINTANRANRAKKAKTASFRRALLATAVASVSIVIFVFVQQPAFAAAKSGQRCTKLAAKSGTLVCTRKAGRLIWAKAPTKAATPTTAVAAPDTAAANTPASAPAAGIEGTWNVAAGEVGYRVKEVLNGQSIEGVGRTSAITGTMSIAGSTVKTVDLTADLTTLKSDAAQRDRQVQGRILDTAKFPKATIKLLTPIDLGSVPADKAEINQKATVSLNLHGVAKDLPLEVKARRNGDRIEINGSVRLVFADFGIPDPSIAPFVTTEDNGLLEFVIAFGR